MSQRTPIDIQVMSDLHLEHRPNPAQFINDLPVEAATIVLAGDITTYNLIKLTLELFASKWEFVIYVPGNHDHYGSSIDGIQNICKRVMEDNSNIFCLNKNSVEIHGHTIHGATLWFSEHPNAPRTVNDFRAITNFEPRAYDENDAAKKYFWGNVKPGDVVVTHYTPTYKSGHQRYAGQPDNCWWHNNMDSLLLGNKPAVWIHGHVHDSFDYEIEEGGTRVVCNPGGIGDDYEHGNMYFNPKKVITVE